MRPDGATVTGEEQCPCGSRAAYVACCGRFHADADAATAEQLMRSRYSAFVLALPGYLLRTWHPSTRPRRLELDDTVWRRLQIVDRVAGGEHDDTGVVEFRATYVGAQGVTVLHERSRFVRAGDAWFYVDGDQLA